MIHHVLIDLDDTLLDFKKSERTALLQTLQELGLNPNDEMLDRYHVINREQWELLERGLITRPQVLLRRFSILFEEYGVAIAAEEAKRIYEDLLGNQCFFVDGALELLEALAKTYSLHLITNGTAPIQRRRLDGAGILPYFTNVFISHEIGYNKPDPRYFEYCFSHISGFSKDTAVIIGDSLSSDILGGNTVGVKTCWFNPTHAPRKPIAIPDYEFDTLGKLPQLLTSL